MCVSMCEQMHMLWYMCKGKRTTCKSFFSLSTVYVPVIKLRSPRWAADAVTAEISHSGLVYL